MIKKIDQIFLLETQNTSYVFQVLPSGHLEHVHYGAKITIDLLESSNSNHLAACMLEKQAFCPGNSISYSAAYPMLSLEDRMLEMSSLGKGDIREPFVELTYSDGSTTCDFLFEKAEILKKKNQLTQLPSAYESLPEKVWTLSVTLVHKEKNIRMELIYSVFPQEDVITRSAKLYNDSNANLQIERLFSLQLDFDRNGFVFTTFNGAWAREMDRSAHIVTSGKHVNETLTGFSSNRSNPFIMLGNRTTTQSEGECYGCNLIYSGNHYESLQVNAYGKSRLSVGIHPTGFSWQLKPGEVFESPEAVMTYSKDGYTKMSHNMHDFIREHIVRGAWKYKERPVLINSWEATYFRFTQAKLLKLAKAAKTAGIELFVLDDGWFGERNDDTSSLGDWYVNQKKLPGGLKGLAEKINEMGLMFGIWVEPEMVNEKSQCYTNHPEWALEIPGQEHSLGRNQKLLDLTNKEVQEYIIEQMTSVFESANIEYVKWDMNRIFSDYYAASLLPGQQKETGHRYILGLCHVMDVLTKRFPDILFEGCASGGNRFDLGMLCYMPQIWASDNTDAICRAKIQQGYSYGYPASCFSAHVSGCPNHQTLRMTPLDTRFQVACFGLLGYECNLPELSKEEQTKIGEQVALYKKWRNVLQFGDFYRIREGRDDLEENQSGTYQWLSVSKDKTRAVAMMLQTQNIPNTVYQKLVLKGLLEKERYHFYNIPQKVNVKDFGSLINAMAPIHIKQDSLLHNVVAHVMKLEGEKEEYQAYGDALMNCGVRLAPSFGGTGFNEQVRLFKDFDSRLYFIEQI
ncbi:MAG: alpha-galactosidase [Clostridiales bacterium]|nr:alpha-galactosidase [Clostridiales bacterium]